MRPAGSAENTPIRSDKPMPECAARRRAENPVHPHTYLQWRAMINGRTRNRAPFLAHVI
jgi:hypothetical protein